MDLGDGLIKVGHSRRPDARRKEIGNEAEIVWLSEVYEQAELIERTAHRLLALAGKHVRGERFAATLSEAIEAIECAVRIAKGQELPLQFEADQDTFLHMRIAEEVKLMLDDLRKGEPDLPSRSEMVRRLIERAHESEKKRGRK